MNRVILIALATISLSSIADDGWEFISGNIVIKDECNQPEKFHELFSLTQSKVYTGVAHLEYIAESLETSFINCPKEFLIQAKGLKEQKQDKLFENFGVVSSPEQISKLMVPLQTDKEVGTFIKQRFSYFINMAKP